MKDGHEPGRGGGGEAGAGEGDAVGVVPAPQREPERGAPPPRVRPVRPQRGRRDHGGRAGAGAGRAGPGRHRGAYVPDGATGLRFEDFDKLHRALGDAFFGALADQQDAATAAGADGGKGSEEDEQEMREAFKIFDVDNDGRCSRSWDSPRPATWTGRPTLSRQIQLDATMDNYVG